MMSGMPLETYCAFNERWNNKFLYKVASCWLFLLSHTTMHESMNIKKSKVYCDIILPSMSRYSSGFFPLGFPIKTSTHHIFLELINLTIFCCWSQWPRGLRRRSAAARLLRLRVRIPPGAWMFVSCERRVMSGRCLCDDLITRPEGSYQLWCVVVCDLETS
jgi:hypothetical protein